MTDFHQTRYKALFGLVQKQIHGVERRLEDKRNKCHEVMNDFYTVQYSILYFSNYSYSVISTFYHMKRNVYLDLKN